MPWFTILKGPGGPLLAFALGVGLCQTLSTLSHAWAIALIAILLIATTRRRPIILILCAFALGLIWTASWAHWRLSSQLPAVADNQIFPLHLTVASLADGDSTNRRFIAEVDATRPADVPDRLLVTWRAMPGARVPELIPGQRWRMVLVLRRPYGNANPHGPDREARLFADGIRATASVRGAPLLLESTSRFRLERARHVLRARLQTLLADQRYGGVLIALVMGDQQSVKAEDWQVFNRSGITHLVSISGLHVTMLSGLAAAFARWLWPRLRWRHRYAAEYLAAQRVAAAVAVVVALAYCLLAGWSVPTRRTFFMLAVVALALQSRLALRGPVILLLACTAVLLLDPWAMLAPGFWLSFGAVAILMKVVLARRDGGFWQRMAGVVSDFWRTQGAVTLGLLPLLAYWIGEVSIISPLANALAIPWVSLVVTPLALLTGAVSLWSGVVSSALANFTHMLFTGLMAPLSWMASWPWAMWPVAAAPLWVVLLAVWGAAWSLQGTGWPARWAGLLCIVPVLSWRPDRPEPGDWRLTALDVGQGTAVLLETATQTLLYDTGPRQIRSWDAGERLVLPFLRARGVRKLDHLVVSHADLDHVGGLLRVLSVVPVAQSWASFSIPAWLTRDRRVRERDGEVLPAVVALPDQMHDCMAGQAWEMDGVRLRFLHPGPERALWPKSNNARSCVLLIEGRRHAALLPGDIARAEERQLLSSLPAVDVVLAPHHGSAGSSSTDFIDRLKASHVIAQAGHWSRFGHPSPVAMRRWERGGAQIWRTDLDGAVTVVSGATLDVSSWRQQRLRYWHTRLRQAARSDTQIGLLHGRILSQLGSPTRHHDSALAQYITTLGHAQGLRGILFCNKHRRAALAQLLYHVKDLGHDARCEAQRGFVEQEQAWRAHECAADGQHLLLTAGERAAGLIQPLRQLRENAQNTFQFAGVAAQRVSAHQQVFAHGQRCKYLACFGYQRQTAMHDLLGRQLLYRLAIQRDFSVHRPQQSCNGAHQGGLACAVAAYQANGLAGFDDQFDVVQDAHRADGGVDVLQLKPHRPGLPDRLRLRRDHGGHGRAGLR